MLFISTFLHFSFTANLIAYVFSVVVNGCSAGATSFTSGGVVSTNTVKTSEFVFPERAFATTASELPLDTSRLTIKVRFLLSIFASTPFTCITEQGSFIFPVRVGCVEFT